MATKRSTKKLSTPVETDISRKIWLASLGAASLLRSRGEALLAKGQDLVGKVQGDAEALKAQGLSQIQELIEKAKERVEDYRGRVQGTVNARLEWAGEQVEARVGQVLGRVGVPSKAEVADLAKRVGDLQRQVKALKAARAA